jgi:hypothetical protein
MRTAIAPITAMRFIVTQTPRAGPRLCEMLI